MSAAAVAVGALAGVAAGLAAEPLVRRLPAGIDDALEQPAWTRALRRPPTMEIVGAVLGAAAGWRLGLVGPLVPALLLIALLVPITFIDIEHRVIPDRLVFPGTAAALVAWALIDPGSLKEHGLAAVIACVVFLVMAIVYPAGMGLGDVKLALMLGAFLGTRGRARPVHRLRHLGRAVDGDPAQVRPRRAARWASRSARSWRPARSWACSGATS